MQARREDEYLGRRHGLIGQETTGIGGMAKALRTIPVILSIAHDMQRLAEPGAPLVNFTNPAGLVTQALANYAPEITAVGVCNAPFNMKMTILQGLAEAGIEVEPESAARHVGTQSPHVAPRLTVDGEDMWRACWKCLSLVCTNRKSRMAPALIESLRMIPNYCLQYFLRHSAQAGGTRSGAFAAEQVMQIEEELFAQYADPGAVNRRKG